MRQELRRGDLLTVLDQAGSQDGALAFLLARSWAEVFEGHLSVGKLEAIALPPKNHRALHPQKSGPAAQALVLSELRGRSAAVKRVAPLPEFADFAIGLESS